MSLVAYGSSDTDSSGSSSSGSGSGGEGPAPAQPAPAQPAPRAQARLQAQLQAQAPLHQLQAATPGPGPGPTITRARAPRGNKRRQAARVHIHIHAPELGEASDSDDEGPFQKKSSPASAAGMGLSALLPQPRNLTLKETNRTLLPHAFTRPPKATGRAAPGRATVTTTTTPSPSAIKAASKNAAKQLARHIMNEKASDEEEEEDEDEEAEGGELSFFSLSDREQPPPPAVAAARTEAYPCVRADQSPPPCPDPADPSDVLNPADAPLEFNRSVSSLGDAGLAANSAPELGGQYPDYHGQEGEQSKYYQNYYDEYYQGLEPAPTPAPEEEHDTFMNDEAFKRLQGKRNRGKEEVSFVEIKGDDQLSGSQQWLMKSLTEEKDMKSFSKKRGEQPTSQQRRKHQITYLIHQAKERELELKNAWSDNRLTKRQTQAKYGF